ncbi:hypothetical protein ES703_114603 [subsurface metagenome]
MSSLVKRLKCHTPGYSPVTDNGNYIVVITGQVAGDGYAQSRRD